MSRSLLPRRLLPQLMLLVVSVLLLSIFLHALHTQREQTTIARAGSANQASALARSLANAAAPSLLLGNIDELDALLQNATEFPEVLEIQASDSEGRLLSHYVAVAGQRVARIIDPPSARLAPPETAVDQVEFDEQRIKAWYPVSAGSPLGWIRVDLSTQGIEDIRRRIWSSTLIYAIIAVSGGSLLVFLFLSQPMAALERARMFAVDLESANGQILPATTAPMEIEDLTTALNHASASLHEQRQNLAALIAQLGERNEQLNSIFKLSADGFVSFDGERRVNYVNPGFTRLTGIDSSALAGLDEAAFSALLASRCLDSGQFKALAAWRAMADDEQGATPSGNARRQVIKLKGAGERVLEIGLRLSATGAISQVLHARDITRESQVDRMKSEFLATAAHELRTPMASIHGFAELLLSTDYGESERREMLAIIYRQSGLMASIIDELLDLVRIEARRGRDFASEALAAGPLLGEAIANFRPPTGRQPPLLTLAEPDCYLLGDRQQLLHVMNNVLANAYKYSPAGGDVTVEVLPGAACGHPDQVAILVRDNGIGMTVEQAGRVGERFYRADSSGQIPGTGLGMSIVKEIIELHGGSLAIDSEPGAGTTVSIFIPQA